MITTANVRSVTLSSPERHAQPWRGQNAATVPAALAERWRWDLNPRRGCPLTRFRGVRPRPLGDSTAGELTLISGSPGLEEVAEQGAALLGEHPADDLRAVVQPGVPQHVPQRAGRPGLGIG